MADSKKPANTINLGDICLSTIEKGSDVPKLDKQGRQQYYLKVGKLPEGVTEIVLKEGDYINFRQVTEAEVAQMPEWKQKIIQLKSWVNKK